MKISEYLKQYRKNNNLTQQDLADKLFVSKQAISKWENDRGLPDINTYPLISEVLGVTIDELMGVEPTKEKEEVITNKKENKKIIIIISLIVTIILSLLIFSIAYDKEKIMINKFTKETEQLLEIDLPSIITIEYLDMKELADNKYYPVNTGYFIFEDTNELKKIENDILISKEWNYYISEDLQNILPLALKMYCNGQNQIKIINIKSKEINIIPNTEGTYTFKMFCYQKEMNRLIVSTFICEVKQ